MTPDYVDTLLDQYDEWHEGYLTIKDQAGEVGFGYQTEEQWQAFRTRLRNHLLRAPGRKTDGPFDPKVPKQEGKLRRAEDPLPYESVYNNIVVNEEADTRKQEL